MTTQAVLEGAPAADPDPDPDPGPGPTEPMAETRRTGTVVCLVPPPAPEPSVARSAPRAVVNGSDGHRRRRVMLIDDEPQVAQTMERLLRRDYDVTVALCGKDALAQIASGLRFDAIVSDVMMPNMTGLELLDELQRMAPDQAARLIFLSGGAFGAQTRERLEALGVVQLDKPITAKDLRASIQRIANHVPPLAASDAAFDASASKLVTMLSHHFY